MGELLQSGLTITAIGMSVVFVLLTALVGIIQAMSVLAHAIAPASPAGGTAAARQIPAADDVVPVIAAAISAYRNKHRDPSS